MSDKPVKRDDALLPGDMEKLLAIIDGKPESEEAAHDRSKSIPVVWIAFADNGNIRLWTSHQGRAQDEKARGLDLRAFTLAELMALVSRLGHVEARLKAATRAISEYLATFDRCGGSEAVSADEFAEHRAALRAAVTARSPDSQAVPLARPGLPEDRET